MIFSLSFSQLHIFNVINISFGVSTLFIAEVILKQSTKNRFILIHYIRIAVVLI